MRKWVRTIIWLGALALPLAFMLTPKGQSEAQNPWTELHAAEHKALAQTLEKELLKRSQEAQTFAANTVLTTNNPPRISQVLTNAKTLHEQVDQLTFHDTHGLLLGASAGANTSDLHSLWQEDPWYATVRGSRESLLASHMDKSGLIFYLAAWNRLHQWMGVLTVRVNLHWVDEILQNFEQRYAFAAMDGYRISLISKNAPILTKERGQLQSAQQLESALDARALKGDWQWALRTQIAAPAAIALKAQTAPPAPAPIPQQESAASLWPWSIGGLFALLTLLFGALWFQQKKTGAHLTVNLQKFQSSLRKKNQKLSEQDKHLQSTSQKILQLNRSFQERRPGFHKWMEECARADEHAKALLRRCSEEADHLQRIRQTGLRALTALEKQPAIAAKSPVGGGKAYELVTQVMQDIEQKTKVIHEIVFQTKLLSFNASVEAARAGEHGRGFAIVAEEVGNLAAMSGTAAKEIAHLLQESLGKIQSLQVEGEPAAAAVLPIGESREIWLRVLQDLDVFIKDFELHRYDVDRLQVFGRQTIESMRGWSEFMTETEQRLKAGQAA